MVPKATPSLLLENFRCFVAPREIPLAPLTFLVGENSSGKTSFLAAVRLAWKAAMAVDTPDFSEAPFDLGSYHDIASFSAESGQGVKQFSLGIIFPAASSPLLSRSNFEMQSRAIFTASNEGRPLLTKKVVDISDPKIMVTVQQEPTGGPVNASVDFPSRINYSAEIPREAGERFGWSYTTLGACIEVAVDQAGGELSEEDRNVLRSVQADIQDALGSHPIAMAPIRTNPKRTYDLRIPTLSPEGMHTPMVLFDFLANDEKKQQAIIGFGKTSGLFTDLRVRQLGEVGGEPFQIQAEMHGHLRNIIDVGYGVSQALPIVGDTINILHDAILLIQQPEVHLHPKAQAGIGTFFAEQMMQRSAPIIVETHSDYMIDRVRLMIRKGQVRKDDIQVLFFSPRKTDVDIIPIELGDDGRIINPPDDYRKFFLDEQLEFFS